MLNCQAQNGFAKLQILSLNKLEKNFDLQLQSLYFKINLKYCQKLISGSLDFVSRKYFLDIVQFYLDKFINLS